MISKGQVIRVIKPGNEVPKMLVPRNISEENESNPEVGHQEGKPEEGPQDSSRVYLKQSIGKPLE